MHVYEILTVLVEIYILWDVTDMNNGVMKLRL